MKKGIFVTIEGPDGSGKSTQIAYIRNYFEKKGYVVVLTREPGGTDISEKIRELILDRENKAMTDMTETLLYAASRAQHVAEVIAPALKAGKVVICDRFVDSSMAYQGYGRGLAKEVEVINQCAVAGCIPDITFLMKIDPAVGKNRIKDEDQDRIEKEAMDFHRRVFEGYKEIEGKNPKRVVGIDATRSIDEIRADIEAKLERAFG